MLLSSSDQGLCMCICIVLLDKLLVIPISDLDFVQTVR